MWFSIQNEQVRLNILAKPNAKKTMLMEISDQGLHISLHAPPQKGEANKELISYLSKLFKLPKNQIILLKERSKHKQVIVPLTAKVQKFLDDPVNFKI